MQKLVKYIIIFAVIFSMLQIIDIELTKIALQNTQIYEMNPLYDHPLFLIGKFGMIFLIAPILYYVGKTHQRIAYSGMILDIGLYLLIVSNNMIQIYLSRAT